MQTKEEILAQFRVNLAEKRRLEQAIEDSLFTEQYHDNVINYFFASPEVDCPFIFALMKLSKLPKENLPSFNGGKFTENVFRKRSKKS